MLLAEKLNEIRKNVSQVAAYIKIFTSVTVYYQAKTSTLAVSHVHRHKCICMYVATYIYALT